MRSILVLCLLCTGGVDLQNNRNRARSHFVKFIMCAEAKVVEGVWTRDGETNERSCVVACDGLGGRRGDFALYGHAGRGASCRGAADVDFTKFEPNPNASRGRKPGEGKRHSGSLDHIIARVHGLAVGVVGGLEMEWYWTPRYVSQETCTIVAETETETLGQRAGTFGTNFGPRF